MMSSNSDSENENLVIIVPDTTTEKKAVSPNLSNKSKKLYTSAYNEFKKWHEKNKSTKFCEDVLLAYFAELSTKYSPPSLWATYSMLKSTINTHDHVDIGRYNNLTAFLKKNNLGYQPKKSQSFSRQNISKFLNDAPDEIHLFEKVALIIGITGALRRDDFVKITVDDVQKLGDDVLLVHIAKTKNCVARSFTITGVFFHFCWKYMQARPKNCTIDKFFLHYSMGKCTEQAVGINKFGSLPKHIAEYLNLPEANHFTGHSFRRTSVGVLVDAGGDVTLKGHGGWISASDTFGYTADSIKNNKRICEENSSRIEIYKQPKIEVPDTEPDHGASTSGFNDSDRVTKTGNVVKNIHNSPTSIPSAPETENSGSKEPRGSCFYHPDIGLFFHDFTNDEAPTPNYIFNNCTVTINSSGNNITLNNCMVTHKN